MKSLLTLLLSVAASLFGCTEAQQSEHNFESVDVATFKTVIAKDSVVVLDVRTASEYAEGHIDNAVNIDVLKDDFETKAIAALPKDMVVALYCRSGRRSKKAASILSQKGYQVVELSSGWNGWVANRE